MDSVKPQGRSKSDSDVARHRSAHDRESETVVGLVTGARSTTGQAFPRATCLNAIPRWLLFGAAMAICVPAHPGAQSASDEYRLKAAFVYRFPQFVEWPAAALQDARTLDLCVLQPNPFGSYLEQLVSGESLGGRPLRVRLVAGVDALVGCHAVFAGARSQAAAAILKAVAGRPVLTVGETDHFLDDGGIIVLKVVERRVRFEVNAITAQKAGLRINAQLLGLAAAVRGGAQ